MNVLPSMYIHVTIVTLYKKGNDLRPYKVKTSSKRRQESEDPSKLKKTSRKKTAKNSRRFKHEEGKISVPDQKRIRIQNSPQRQLLRNLKIYILKPTTDPYGDSVDVK